MPKALLAPVLLILIFSNNTIAQVTPLSDRLSNPVSQAISEMQRKMGWPDKAHYNASLAFTNALDLKNDSLEIIMQLEFAKKMRK